MLPSTTPACIQPTTAFNAAARDLLTVKHRHLLVTERGIDPDVLARGEVRSISGAYALPTPDPVYRHPDPLKARWYGQHPRVLGPGIHIPFIDSQGQRTYQFRPDAPRIEISKDGKQKAIKYESPPGCRLSLYIHPDIRPILRDAHEPIRLTEGPLKAMAAISYGYPTIGIAGVSGWVVKGDPAAPSTPLPEWDEIEWRGRICYLEYDSDVTAKPAVRDALLRICEEVRSRGGRPIPILLPNGPDGSKQGVDDFLVSGGDLRALEQAVLFGVGIEADTTQQAQDEVIDLALAVLAQPDEQATAREKVVHLATTFEAHRRARSGIGLLGNDVVMKLTGLPENAVSALSRDFAARSGSPYERWPQTLWLQGKPGEPDDPRTVICFKLAHPDLRSSLRALPLMGPPSAEAEARRARDRERKREAQLTACETSNCTEVRVRGGCNRHPAQGLGRVVVTREVWQKLISEANPGFRDPLLRWDDGEQRGETFSSGPSINPGHGIRDPLLRLGESTRKTRVGSASDGTFVSCAFCRNDLYRNDPIACDTHRLRPAQDPLPLAPPEPEPDTDVDVDAELRLCVRVGCGLIVGLPDHPFLCHPHGAEARIASEEYLAASLPPPELLPLLMISGGEE